ncbi:MAG TPA: cytochrome c [Urbifossiella sp.]|jgi:hypothetical protein
MVRKAGLTFAGTLALMIALGAASADDKKTPTTKMIMKTLFGAPKGEMNLCQKCVAAGKGEKWDEAQKYAKTLADLGASLPKNPCPRGDADSWEKLTKQFAEQTKAIAKAADDKDSKEFEEATGKFTKACGACHMAHRAKKGK